MRYRRLGQSGLTVSNVCLGAMTFGEADASSMMFGASADEDTSFALCNRALDAGVNFIDTADVYGQDGLSERVIGRWFARDRRRDEVVLATKFRFRMGPGVLGTGASRRRVVSAAEASLRRLGTDRLDLFQIHMQDVETPEEETLRALDDLVRAGKVLYIGCSNYAAYRLVDSLWTSKDQRLERVVSLQVQYSLVERSIEREHVPAALQWGVGLLPWSPLAQGFLTGRHSRSDGPVAGSRLAQHKWRWDRAQSDRNWAILDILVTEATALGVPPSRLALAWLLHRPAVSSVVVGARTVSQLDDTLPAGDLDVPAEVLDRLDTVSRPDFGYPYTFMAHVQGRW